MSYLLPYQTVVRGHSDRGDQRPNLRARGLIAVEFWRLIIVSVGTFVGGFFPTSADGMSIFGSSGVSWQEGCSWALLSCIS
jgi:hypothetical protein